MIFNIFKKLVVIKSENHGKTTENTELLKGFTNFEKPLHRGTFEPLHLQQQPGCLLLKKGRSLGPNIDYCSIFTEQTFTPTYNLIHVREVSIHYIQHKLC